MQSSIQYSREEHGATPAIHAQSPTQRQSICRGWRHQPSRQPSHRPPPQMAGNWSMRAGFVIPPRACPSVWPPSRAGFASRAVSPPGLSAPGLSAPGLGSAPGLSYRAGFSSRVGYSAGVVFAFLARAADPARAPPRLPSWHVACAAASTGSFLLDWVLLEVLAVSLVCTRGPLT